MTRSDNNPWLLRFAAFVAFNTLLLIGLGGLVTSKEAGMAVPDWPTTYGQNMFLFPPSLWQGGVLYEHTHRLFASWVGLLTVALGIWTHFCESRRWIRRLAFLAILLVILQGVLGGMRVVLLKAQIGIIHAGLAQSFLALLCVLTLGMTRFWRSLTPSGAPAAARRMLVVAVAMVFLQLLIGATMRHEHAGLAIPDFPLAYGKLWPATDAAALQRINLSHPDVAVTAGQIHLHMFHRLWAVALLFVSFWMTRRIFLAAGPRSPLGKGILVWQGLLVLQALLGASTVWTGRAADITTLHVVVGAVCLSFTVILTAVAFRLCQPGISTRASISTSGRHQPEVAIVEAEEAGVAR
ncbi:MAG: COX15/CtaA family protein [Verrucomicrobia bacterium]|nr:COX15/CtaA family protein [Verrucomicrobiota bacterium]MBI3870663.1 COX15/CtaA family protein [Verrucomicrobiota bacterium]